MVVRLCNTVLFKTTRHPRKCFLLLYPLTLSRMRQNTALVDCVQPKLLSSVHREVKKNRRWKYILRILVGIDQETHQIQTHTWNHYHKKVLRLGKLVMHSYRFQKAHTLIVDGILIIAFGLLANQFICFHQDLSELNLHQQVTVLYKTNLHATTQVMSEIITVQSIPSAISLMSCIPMRNSPRS